MRRVPLASVSFSAAFFWLRVFSPKPALADQLPVTPVTFNDEITTLLNNHCTMCHYENGLSFPVETYEQTFFKRFDISESILTRHMPPWAADPAYGEFANSNALNFREVQFMLSWIYGSTPRNSDQVFLNVVNPKAKPAAIIQARFDPKRWDLGKPDMELAVPEGANAQQQGTRIAKIVVDPNFTVDHWLSGLEFKPANRRAVHAVFFSVQENNQWIGSWTPWYSYFRLPQGLAYRLAAGAHIVAEVYYAGDTAPAGGDGTLGLYFAEQPSGRTVASERLRSQCEQKTDATSQKCSGTATLDRDENILALWPALSANEEAVEVTAEAPDGAIRVLLYARNPVTAWPTPYILKEPLNLVRGTRLSVVSYYGGERAPPSAQAVLTVSGFEGMPVVVGKPSITETQGATKAAPLERRFKLAGVVQSVDSKNHSLVVRHGVIPGFMGAMTMTYLIRSDEDLTKISAGDEIQADLVVNESEMHLENIKLVGHSK